MSNKWITDRLPTAEDALNTYDFVWHTNDNGHVVARFWGNVQLGEPWMRSQTPEPYVKPVRYEVRHMQDVYPGIAVSGYCVIRCFGGVDADKIPTREAAERIAAIYEEVMP